MNDFEMITDTNKAEFYQKVQEGCSEIYDSENHEKTAMETPESELDFFDESDSDFARSHERAYEKGKHAAKRRKDWAKKETHRKRVRVPEFFELSKQEQRDVPGRSAYSMKNLSYNHAGIVFDNVYRAEKKAAEDRRALVQAQQTYINGGYVADEYDVKHEEMMEAQEDISIEEMENFVKYDFFDMLIKLSYLATEPKLIGYIQENCPEMYQRFKEFTSQI